VKADRAVGNWLILLAAMVFGMVIGGGHARTIGAGFSIQEWKPITGFIPPMSDGDWARLYGLYQDTSVFQAHPISLDAYKALFWPMFLDRCWGRLIALTFLLPFAYFLVKGRISRWLGVWLGAIFLAGAGQATMGWYMVKTARYPGVMSPPPEWLAPHLLSAMLVLAVLLWTGLTVRRPEPVPVPGVRVLRHWTSACVLLVWVTMGYGALVAATNAVTVFNTFPLMDGGLLPPGFLSMHPLWVNFVENQGTVQFCHRVLATVTAVTLVATAVMGLRAELPPWLRDLFLLMAGLVSLQYLLGMTTLVLAAPELGYVHELNAVLLFATAVAARHGLRGAVRG
jgi:cytochrome c oxidase assembly protein subunit 15